MKLGAYQSATHAGWTMKQWLMTCISSHVGSTSLIQSEMNVKRWLFHGTEQNTLKTQNSSATSNCSV